MCELHAGDWRGIFLSAAWVALAWKNASEWENGDPLTCTRRSTIPRSDTSVCGITIQRLSVRTVCRVREISGRYKFGEEIALSKDGDRRPRARSRFALGRSGAGAFTCELGDASPCSLA